MLNIAILLIGFSVFYGLVFILILYKDQKAPRFFGIVLMMTLVAIQLMHFFYLSDNSKIIFSPVYLILLYLVAPCFYFYSRPVLKVQSSLKVVHVLHFVPLVFALILNRQMAFILAFVIGSGYLLWLLVTVYALRQHRNEFVTEILLLSLVFMVAVAVSVVALLMPFTEKLFYALYASAIGVALLLVALVLISKPKISDTVTEVAKQTYAISTLTSIDCDGKIKQLRTLIETDKIYRQNNLDLQTIATEIDLTTHQLSELINTQLKMSFSSYLREQRIKAAKILLIAQPSVSVLSIGMEVGFSSQSNFYEAFKEYVDTTPAKFRRLNS